jgi:3-hydroxyacyl-[acyl-carrier-protein] dehydratase
MDQPTTLDVIVDVQPGVSARALRNVPNTLTTFDHHFPRFPVLPGVLMIDSLSELAALAGGLETWRLAGAQRVQFRHFVAPGDQMELEAKVLAQRDDELTVRCTVHVDGRLVARVGWLSLRFEPSEVTR